MNRPLYANVYIRLLGSLGLLVLSSMLFAAEKKEETLSSLLDEIWQYEISISPFMASSEGNTISNHLLPDLSEKSLNEQHKALKQFKKRLEKIDPSALDQVSRINLLMQDYRLNNMINYYEFKSYYTPLTSEYGFHSQLEFLPNYAKLDSEKGIQDYLSRLSAIPAYFEQNMHWMKEGIEKGMMHPKEAMVGFGETIQIYITDPEKSIFYAPLLNLPHYIDQDKQIAFQSQAKKILADQVIPAYKQLYDFMVNDYLPKGTETIGVIYWPRGEEFYAIQTKHYTTTDMSPKEIHELGLSEVKRIKAEMQKIVDGIEFNGTLSDFVQFLRTDPQFYAKTAEDLIKEASYIAKQMDAKLPLFFEKLPRTPYGVAPVPESIAPKYTTGRYVSPSNDREPGYYWVNTYALDKRPLYALPALTLHEAVPGHHMQIMLARENTGLPNVRKTYISAFGEGWGLYSEYLGIEADIYKTPYDHYGRLSYEMWRACRLVVDTGLHLYGWTRQQAIDFMLDNTALSEHNVKTEVDRYITWPAQALSYKIGELKIRQLRLKAESTLQQKFDIREFHTAILEHGSVPLFILEEHINTYIDNKKL